jgi:hypothetical protein
MRHTVSNYGMSDVKLAPAIVPGNTVPIVLVILKSACFLNHALLPRDLKARDLKSARSADFVKFWL